MTRTKSPRPTAFSGRDAFHVVTHQNSVIDGGRPEHAAGDIVVVINEQRPARRRHSPGGRNPLAMPATSSSSTRAPFYLQRIDESNGTWMKPGRLHLRTSIASGKVLYSEHYNSSNQACPLTAGGRLAARTKKNGDLFASLISGASDHRHAVGDSTTHHRCQASTGERTTAHR